MSRSQSGAKSLHFINVRDPVDYKDASQHTAIRKHVIRRFWGQINDKAITKKAQVMDTEFQAANQTFVSLLRHVLAGLDWW